MRKGNKSNENKAVKRSCPMDEFVIKKSKFETQDDSILNSSDVIKSKKKIPNPFDSDSDDIDSNYDQYDDKPLSVEEQKILNYFNEASVDDLTQITGCSETKSLDIIKKRPFHRFDDLTKHKINDKIINGCLEILVIKENLSTLLKKCEQISSNLTKRIKPLLSSIELDTCLSGEVMIKEQPHYLNSELKLKPYQMIGINWLRIVHEENLNGILADEMGLGKTVQTIAFLSYLLDQGHIGPHIIIVPTSTLNNWERELRRWCSNLKVIVYYGSMEERRHLRYEILSDPSFHVFLTTYNTSISNKDDRVFIKKIKFHYGVFDEAHMLKNVTSIRYQHMSNLKIKRKLLLTGTPLQNNLIELISLLSFVMPNMFMSKNDGLKKIFQMTQKTSQKQSTFNEEKIGQIKEMLTPFCLRRLKSQVLSHLPTKTVEIVKLPMIGDQLKLYNKLIQSHKMNQSNIDETDSKSAMTRVMELRKLSNHSLLIRQQYNDDILRKMSHDMLLDEDHIAANEDLIFEDFSGFHDFEIHQLCDKYNHAIGKYRLDNKLLYQSNKIRYLDEQLPVFIDKGDKVLIFSQFVMNLDIIGQFLDHKRIAYLRLDGSTSADDRQVFIDQFNESDDFKVFILTTRAGGLGINLTSANVVIIHDIDYNPYNDRQAEDRSHRLGQTRDVRVIKLISKSSIDECILQIANEKLKLEQITMNYDNDEDESKSNSSESKDVDFESLFKQAIEIDI